MKCLFCLVAVFLLAAPAYGSTDPPTTTPAAGSCMSEIQTCSTTYANDAAGKTSEEDFCPVYDAFVECVEDGCTADELSGMSAWKDAAEEALEDLGFDCCKI
ncbi:hypothetical protein BaRGS_00015428 [Batillaria attramentaria]|uniref:Extracellular membrane protein CFEM domain-containing protein n=1 Tax=Batillaria attramentaria TaxID=370345 RepID=A0ABD0L2L3_9CAEN